MRLFEIFIATALLAAFVNFALPQRRRPLRPVVLSAAVTLFVVLHLVIERYRWQMVPIYALLGLVAVVTVALLMLRRDPAQPGRQTKRRHIARIGACGIGILYLAAATTIAVLFPVVSVPAPTGPFAVGTTSMHFADTSRFETLTEDPTDRREFDVKIWYPADEPGKRTSYQEAVPVVGSITNESSVDIGGGTPDFVFGHVSLIRAPSTLDVPLASRQPTYPVLFFSPASCRRLTIARCTRRTWPATDILLSVPTSPMNHAP